MRGAVGEGAVFNWARGKQRQESIDKVAVGRKAKQTKQKEEGEQNRLKKLLTFSQEEGNDTVCIWIKRMKRLFSTRK